MTGAVQKIQQYSQYTHQAYENQRQISNTVDTERMTFAINQYLVIQCPPILRL
ncbi:hypothetical protein EI42_01054 [Thermosporothrix hazakensis]|jgi:hypothetical protein|uniref:Uncharacterized protein n=2 Tax=Thermosporothrix TaxID=768650 RepID=A0A326URU7_THEHA|nr:hypothetical protein [Thermosporothrix hazakensis]PZW34217.1 hypothetical protein EI42_01054 [Thermosporothrix hazakensis]BBH85335.1 hypothetical protein KTC_00860 [Thermosporothrix sp. COM3]GCE46234.1 hypothetical protein KTH_11030 [Thermosporothrix hazakensis]